MLRYNLNSRSSKRSQLYKSEEATKIQLAQDRKEPIMCIAFSFNPTLISLRESGYVYGNSS